MKPTFQNLDELFAAAQGSQINLRDILENRAIVFGSWQDIETSEELRLNSFHMVIAIIGGIHKTKDAMMHKLQNGSGLKHWCLERFILCKYNGDKRAEFEYCCGQDWDSEMVSIRKFLKSN